MGNRQSRGHYTNGDIGSVISRGELIDTPGQTGDVILHWVNYFRDELNRVTQVRKRFVDVETQADIGDGQATTQYTYNGNGDILSIVDDNGNTTTFEYDRVNRLSTVTDAAGNTTSYTYDASSNLLSVTEVDLSDLGRPSQKFVTSYTYDSLDRRVTRTDTVGNTTRYAYDSRNNPVLEIDANGHKTRRWFDNSDRLLQTYREVSSEPFKEITTSMAWDASSRLIYRWDDNDNRTSYRHDALNRLVELSYSDETFETRTYDVHDNLIQRTDPNGTTTTMTYDLLNRLTDVAVAPGPDVSTDTTFEHYAYDGYSRPVRIEDDDSVVTRSYDSLSRVTAETQNDAIILREFDGMGNKTCCSFPGGRNIATTHDVLNRRKTISDDDGTIATYNYIGPRRVERKTLGNGTRVDLQYDGITGLPNAPGDFGVKQIVGSTHSRIADGAVIDARTFAWDAVGNKVRRTDVRLGGPQLAHSYAYDGADRLIQTIVTDAVSNPVRDTAYSLDGVGNRISVAGSPDAGAYSLVLVDPTEPEYPTNRYSSTPFDRRSYDQNANLVSRSVGDANGDGLLGLDDLAVGIECTGGPFAPPASTASCPMFDLNGDADVDLRDFAVLQQAYANGAAPSELFAYNYRDQLVSYSDLTGLTTSYRYDTFGRRIAKTTLNPAGPDTTFFFYDDFTVVEERDDSGATLATYVTGNYLDETLTMRRASTDYYYHADDLYNVTALTDSTGNVIERYEYSDYGRVQVLDPGGAPRERSAIGNPYGFTGRRLDPESGLCEFRFRYLDSRAGRFMTRDPLGAWYDPPNRGNPYTQVGSNPASRVDPFGTQGIPLGFSIPPPDDRIWNDLDRPGPNNPPEIDTSPIRPKPLIPTPDGWTIDAEKDELGPPGWYGGTIWGDKDSLGIGVSGAIRDPELEFPPFEDLEIGCKLRYRF